MKLNPNQILVRAHYCGGELLYVNTKAELKTCGDGLFRFLMDEAHDAESAGEFKEMLERAILQLRCLETDLS